MFENTPKMEELIRLIFWTGISDGFSDFETSIMLIIRK